MFKTFDHIKVISNKILLHIGFPYARVRYSDIQLYGPKLLDKTSTKALEELTHKHDELMKQINLNNIIETYNRYFKRNILNVHYDLLRYQTVMVAKLNVDKIIAEIDTQDLLLLSLDNILKRTDLVYLSNKLDILIDIKVLENNILLLFS